METLTRNQFVYELSDGQCAIFDLAYIKNLITTQTDLFRFISNVPPIRKIFNDDFFGASLFILSDAMNVSHAHIDSNLLPNHDSRHSALNFVMGEGAVHEWYAPINPKIRETTGYHYEIFPLQKLLFGMSVSRPTLINTDVPHRGYSIPSGIKLVSLGFRKPFAKMVQFFETQSVDK